MKIVFCVLFLYTLCSYINCLKESEIDFKDNQVRGCREVKPFDECTGFPKDSNDPYRPTVYNKKECEWDLTNGNTMCLNETQARLCTTGTVVTHGECEIKRWGMCLKYFDGLETEIGYVADVSYGSMGYEYHLLDEVDCQTKQFIRKIETEGVPETGTTTEEVIAFEGPEELNIKNLKGANKDKIVLPDITQSVMADKATVISWTVDAVDDKPLTLGFWRETTGNYYKLVGHTTVNPGKTGEQTFALTPEQQYEVLKGDVVGIFRPASDPIHYSRFNNCAGRQTFMMINSNIKNNVGEENRFRPQRVCGDPLVTATLSVKA